MHVAVGWWWWGLAFCVKVAPWWGLCVAGWCHGGPCVLCWDGVMAGLTHDELALWADLACSDGVAVAVDLHVVKIEAAMGLHAVKQRQRWGLARLEG